jgi:hypothetical protein
VSDGKSLSEIVSKRYAKLMKDWDTKVRAAHKAQQ